MGKKNNYYTDCHKGKFFMNHPEKYLVVSSDDHMVSALEDYWAHNATLEEKQAWMEYVKAHAASHGSWSDFVNTSGMQSLKDDWTEYVNLMVVPEYKSEWEKKMCVVCDDNPFIVRWSYEPFTISYHSPLYMKQSLYKPDFYVECRYDTGEWAKYLIEVKPTTYSVLPTPPKPLPEGCTDQKKIDKFKKKQQSYSRKSLDVAVNYAKWAAAEVWCKNHHINWFIANEKNTKGLFDASKPV